MQAGQSKLRCFSFPTWKGQRRQNRCSRGMLSCRPCTTGSCLGQPRRKRSIRLIFLADAGRDRIPLLYRSCTCHCEVLRRNQRQYLQVAAQLDAWGIHMECRCLLRLVQPPNTCDCMLGYRIYVSLASRSGSDRFRRWPWLGTNSVCTVGSDAATEAVKQCCCSSPCWLRS